VNDPAQLYAEAVSHFTAGRADKAEELCRALIRSQPANADAYNLLGLALRRSARHEDALAAFERAGGINAKLAPVHLNRGLTLIDLNRLEAAESAFRDALNCDAESAPAYFHLGLVLHHLARFEDASAHFRRVIAKDPGHANSHALLGVGLLQQGKLAEARVSLETAAGLAPNVPTIHDGLGVVAADEGRVDDALAHFDKALSLDAQFAPSHFNRAALYLRRGDLERGLPELEWRWRLPRDTRPAKMRDFPQPLWTGESLGEASLLVWGEQGLGDEIRAAGIVDDLLRRDEKVVLECDPRLTALLQRSLPRAKIIARSDPPSPETLEPHVARQCPGDTLLRHVRPTLARFPRRASYLQADPGRAAAARASFPSDRPAVGVSWGSWNAQFARGKAVALTDWREILTQGDFTFVDLQYGDTAAERAAAQNNQGIALTHLPDLDLTNDIDGLAALISACDLVITVSNTTAHLAGALGIPTWVMLPFGHFQPWYWFSERTDSPWYPSVKLYRQSKFGDWPNVIKRVAQDLSKFRA
jgi:tetratricopeptide (TPR) repeat protein